jgi:hypothetical protein
LSDAKYLNAFAGMIVASLNYFPAAPNAYAEYMNALVGHPLALVNMGWSLELAQDAYATESKLEGASPSMYLLPDGANKVYQFPMKLGDRDRVYDGMVAYFDTSENLSPGDELNLDTFYTYYDGRISNDTGTTISEDPLCIIGAENYHYPEVQAFWANPANYTETQAADLYTFQNQQLQVFGALINPFTPVQVYTSFLPIQPIELPSWTWQSAMAKMTAFFRLGSFVMPTDVPAFDKQYELTPSSGSGDVQLVPKYKALIPNSGIAEWNWLQPYYVKGEKDAKESGVEKGSGSENKSGTKYMALELAKGEADGRPRFEKGPYTAVEGYLQLRRPMVSEKEANY